MIDNLTPKCARHKHQVAGHGLLLEFGEGRLLKPSIPNELEFYQAAHSFSGLQPFLPQFHGVLKVGKVTEGASAEKPRNNEFIILEDLAAKYRNPCVLDLKMGTRHWLATPDKQKRERAIRKCNQSTSAKLGFRVSGMQVYHSFTREYLRRDKKYGHGLTHDDVHESFRLFFWNGRRVRHELIPQVLECIGGLRETLTNLPTHRFYSSSLLLMYEGGQPRVPLLRPTVRLIDFGKSCFGKELSSGCDQGLLLGLDSVVGCLSRVLRECEEVVVLRRFSATPPLTLLADVVEDDDGGSTSSHSPSAPHFL